MELKTCEYCGTSFDASLRQCPLCGKAAEPAVAEPIVLKSDGETAAPRRREKGGKRLAKNRAKPAAKPAEQTENPYVIPKGMMKAICIILGAAVAAGAAFAIYNLKWFAPKDKTDDTQQTIQAEPQPTEPQQPSKEQYMNEEDYTPPKQEETQGEQPAATVACTALTLSTNTVTFEESEVLDISSADGTRIPRGESNLVYRSAKGLFEKVGKQIPPLKITQTNPIPMARGLGSSSACIIAGLLGANRMLGDVLNTQELLTLATSIEGHPDNVAPALLGGLTSSVFEDGKVYSVKRNVDETLCFAAIVPDYKLLTEAARAALPKEVSHKDAVYNLSRAALVPAAFCEGRHDLLAIATEDKLHQPYRMPLMPGSKEVFDMARLCGAKAVYVSGAGSTVMAVAEKAEAEKFYSKLEKGLELLEGLDGCEAFTLLRLDADNTGATVE